MFVLVCFFAIFLLWLGSFHAIRVEIVGTLIFILFVPAFCIGWLTGGGRKQVARWKIAFGYSIVVVLLIILLGFKSIANLLKVPSAGDVRPSGEKIATTAEIDKQLAESAEKNSKTLPRMLDPEIRLDRNVTKPGKLVYYFYTLMNIKSPGLDPDRVAKLLRPHHLEDFCSAPEMRIFREHDVKMEHIYSGSDGIQIARIQISPADCTSKAGG
ncbi:MULTISPECIES: hypothetical protein [unclassified Acidovorax]|uniref:hypothetical protein n=1 Tax=unclassified Acidovorax TaxID=2684926 RepID=UPI0012E3239E|nr:MULTISPECIES: hypothetical protein [unclassified Acidovorax]